MIGAILIAKLLGVAIPLFVLYIIRIKKGKLSLKMNEISYIWFGGLIRGVISFVLTYKLDKRYANNKNEI